MGSKSKSKKKKNRSNSTKNSKKNSNVQLRHGNKSTLDSHLNQQSSHDILNSSPSLVLPTANSLTSNSSSIHKSLSASLFLVVNSTDMSVEFFPPY